ncbi:hypothetical protein HPP92_006934 [Vanilla planifolia]|uniref:Pentatricopeptide repeat-containing protein n=1 Tax=Vanilla planifolia TaxID=51239 RepID=A0A835V875_VANPL|nr:hypothetical protein HPP92_006934 [Vanilla planifolia]
MVKEMQEFDSATLVIVLSSLARMQNLKQGTGIHGVGIKRRFCSDVQLCNALINMYAKCGDMSSSESVFEDIGAKDGTSWSTVINGSLYNGMPEKSAFYFREMIRSAAQPDRVSLSSVISACSFSCEFYGLGEAIHGFVVKLGSQELRDNSIENSLISFYSYHGDVGASKNVFHGLSCKNTISWNSMIHALVENQRIDEALQLFSEMSSALGLPPNAVTLIAIIPACHMLGLYYHGKSCHAFVVRRQMEPSNPSMANCLLDMYLKFEDFVYADLLFSTMPIRDLISWNTMISGYAKDDFLRHGAQILFCKLLHQDVRCSLATLVGLLPSCKGRQDLSFGKSLHSWGIRYGLATNVSAANALMLMYVSCNDMPACSLLLGSILTLSDIISLNTVIVGFVQYGQYKDAIKTFQFMLRSLNLQPDPITFVSALSACGNLALLHLGRSMHGLIAKSSAGLDLMARNALITMYFRCGDPWSSELLFQTNKDRNLCSWNCMISGFVQNRDGRSALEYFKLMGSHIANEFSLVGVLCACSQLGNLRLGREVHGYVIKSSFHSNSFISSTLLDMYGKCGRLDISEEVFKDSSGQSVASWNSMISAYGLHGHGEKAINLFTTMTQQGIQPTKSTFIALLSACTHSGLIEEGCKHYNLMKEEFGVEPTTEHNVCMVEMLGRDGRTCEAFEFLKKLGIRAEPGTLGALLSACVDHDDLAIGKAVAEQLFCLEPDNFGYHVSLSNLYAYHGMWSMAEQVRNLVRDRGFLKPAGCSFIYH